MTAAGVPVGVQAATGVSVADILPFGGPGYAADKSPMAGAKGGLEYGVSVTCDPTIIDLAKCRTLVRAWINSNGYNPDDYSVFYSRGSVPLPTYP